MGIRININFRYADNPVLLLADIVNDRQSNVHSVYEISMLFGVNKTNTVHEMTNKGVVYLLCSHSYCLFLFLFTTYVFICMFKRRNPSAANTLTGKQ